MFYIFLICCLFLIKNISGFVIFSDDGPVVESDIGLIRGLRSDEGKYSMFMGIPYATVDKSNIFGNSIPHPPFQEPFDAYDDSAICPQVEEFNHTIVGSLDCLHLNVYVPDSATSDNYLPVMVYIYGGLFSIGFAGRFLYGPEYLVRHDVILVTFNYRVGPYGFMCLGTSEVPGNAGIKDQVTALRWIKNNINSFGGNANQVTVFGNSAGGMSGGFHIISETEKLFSKVIIQSGPLFLPGLIDEPDTSVPIKIAANLDFVTDDVNEALSFISNVSEHTLIKASTGLSFGACIEKAHPGEERIVPELPINSNFLKVKDVSMLIGYNSDESLVFFPEDADPELWSFWDGRFESNLMTQFSFGEVQMSSLVKLVKTFYIGDNDVNNEVREEALQFNSDWSFIYPSIRSIDIYLEAGAEQIYQYVFSYDGHRNFVKVKDNITTPGAAHADEIGYLFKMEFIPNDPTPEDQLIIDRITAMWTNFAKFSDPTPEVNSLLPVKWEPITQNSPHHYLEINSEMRASTRFENRRMAFWDLFFNAYRTYERGYIGSDENVPDSSFKTSTGYLFIGVMFIFIII